MNSYELMVIFTPVLSNEEYKVATKNLKKFITDNEGEIVGEDAWGLKSFAYPIAKKTTGLYYVMEYTAPPTLNAKFQVQMSRDESIMRNMITSLDKHAVAYNNRKRNGGSAPKQHSVTEKEEA
jgi:small subunit ribosomal protein S6